MIKSPFLRPSTSKPEPQQITPQDTKIQSVHSLELFFDLVFVFTISQITKLIAHPHHAIDYLQAGMVFWSIVWIYGAFVWLTSNLHLEKQEGERWNLLLGMLCFFGMAVGVTPLAEGNGLLFAVSLLSAVTVIIFGFLRMPNSSHYAITKLAPYNFTTGLLVLLAIFLPSPWRWLVWGVAILLYYLPLMLYKTADYPFSFSPRHFVERHGLVTIIALGEGIVVLGTEASGQPLSLEIMAYCVAGLLLLTDCWWLYFGQNQPDIEHRLVEANPERRVELANALNGGHLLLLAGCVLLAGSFEVGILHPLQAGEQTMAMNLTLGAVMFLLALQGMRWRLGLRLHSHLWYGIMMSIISFPIGLWVNGLWQLMTLALMLLAICFIKADEMKR